MNNRITFLVQGSSDEPYEVDFYKEDDKLRRFAHVWLAKIVPIANTD